MEGGGGAAEEQEGVLYIVFVEWEFVVSRPPRSEGGQGANTGGLLDGSGAYIHRYAGTVPVLIIAVGVRTCVAAYMLFVRVDEAA